MTVLSYWEDMDPTAIAALLNIGEVSVKRRGTCVSAGGVAVARADDMPESPHAEAA